MPDTRRSGRAGPPKNPATVTIPPIPAVEHDTAFFDLLDDSPDPGRRARSTARTVRTMTTLSAAAVAARRGQPLDRGPRRPRATATWKPVELSVTQRHDLIDVWTTMFTDVYVHYTQKRALYGFDPIRALAALRRQIPYLDSAGFLRELTLLINRLRDQHTQLYVDAADQTLTGYVAALPFLVEPFGSHLSPDLRRHEDHRRRPRRRLRRRCARSRPGTASRSREPSTSTPKPSPEDAPTPAAPEHSKPSPNDPSSTSHHPTSSGSTSATDSTPTPPATPTARSGSSGEPSSPPKPSPPTT